MVNKPLVVVAGVPTTTQLSDTDIAGTTTGAVPFVASGMLTEDATNLFWDETNKRLGISTVSPQQALHVVGSGRFDDINGSGSIAFSSSNTSFTHCAAAIGTTFNYVRGRGTFAAPAAVHLNDLLGTFAFSGYGDGTTQVQGAFLRATVIETTPSPTAMGTRLQFDVTPLGAAASTEIVRIEAGTGLSMFGANPVIDQNRGIVLRGFTVATLPALSGTSTKMPTAFVNDSTLPIGTGLGLAVVGGGTNRVPVFDDGTSWKIG